MENYDVYGDTPETGILINDVEYFYSITQSEKHTESLIIKFYETTPKTDIYFTYEAPIEKIRKEIQFLDSCDNLDEMIKSLNKIFYQGNAVVKENNGNFNLELKFFEHKRPEKSIIQLIKHDPKSKSELEDKMDKLEIKLKTVLNKFKKYKTEKESENNYKEDNIKNIIKEIINEKKIIFKLFEEIE